MVQLNANSQLPSVDASLLTGSPAFSGVTINSTPVITQTTGYVITIGQYVGSFFGTKTVAAGFSFSRTQYARDRSLRKLSYGCKRRWRLYCFQLIWIFQYSERLFGRDHGDRERERRLNYGLWQASLTGEIGLSLASYLEWTGPCPTPCAPLGTRSGRSLER